MFTLPSSIPATKAAAAIRAKAMTNDESALADLQSGWVTSALDQIEAGLPRVEEAIRELRRAVDLSNAGDEQSSADAVQIWRQYGSTVTGLLAAL